MNSNLENVRIKLFIEMHADSDEENIQYQLGYDAGIKFAYNLVISAIKAEALRTPPASNDVGIRAGDLL